jgi:signal peptidase I
MDDNKISSDPIDVNKTHDLSALKQNASVRREDTNLVTEHYAKKTAEALDTPTNPVTDLIVGFFKWIFDSVQVVVIALAIFIVFYLFIVSPHTIDGVSMQPNFCNGDLILADKLSPRFKGYQYSDVIVFKHDDANDYIKRIIGKSGDRIKVSEGRIYRNDVLLDEPYLPQGRLTLVQPGDGLIEGEDYTVPEGKYFVFGDNRPNSTDSRRFLAIDPNVNTIKGRVIVIMWPMNRARIFHDEVARPVDECNK